MDDRLCVALREAEEIAKEIKKLIARAPSNRQIGKEIGVDHKTIARARVKGEELGRIPQLEKTVGADGKTRKRPEKKPA